ncbi:MAG: hypothetical protein U1F68_11710 [Gammaproteobacteria bacterium]
MHLHGLTIAEFLATRPSADSLRADSQAVVLAIASACKTIAETLGQGALSGMLGNAGSTNIHGEAQKKLDVLANDWFIQSLRATGCVAAAVSEEMADARRFPDTAIGDSHAVLFDPLDGSNNIEINGILGSIFSILRLPPTAKAFDERLLLQPGRRQICAGYALYDMVRPPCWCWPTYAASMVLPWSGNATSSC